MRNTFLEWEFSWRKTRQIKI